MSVEKTRPELVVLVHGLSRSRWSMLRFGIEARRRGFETLYWDYPSRRRSIDAHVRALDVQWTSRLAAHSGRVHFITHSLGGIIVRHYLSTVALPNVGRVVMLGPPNGGSEIVDRLQRLGVARLAGAPALQLGTDLNSFPRTLPAPAFELGVVAGDRSWNPILSRRIGEPNDGKVSVERTRVQGMTDFVIVPNNHTSLTFAREARNATFAFLDRGRFAQ